MSHLLVTNDFPPKAGGIQSYLWELWRRLPEGSFQVLTASHKDAPGFDGTQPYRIERVRAPMLMPTRGLEERIRRRADAMRAGLVVLDPALPLGLVGPRLGRPYAVVVHGAEIAVPAGLPAARDALARVLSNAALLVAAGRYPEAVARSAAGQSVPPVAVVPPGVDGARFRPLSPESRRTARARLGLPVEGPLVLSVSRLVPRKGMATLVEAASRLSEGRPSLTVAITGAGRQRRSLARMVARSGAPVRLLGHVADRDLPELYACADVFVMLARRRWGGLEQEGFGIVFLEAAASGIPQVAGDSGGAGEAVVDGETGFVLRRPADPGSATAALARLLEDEQLRSRLGAAARARALQEFSCDRMAQKLASALAEAGG